MITPMSNQNTLSAKLASAVKAAEQEEAETSLAAALESAASEAMNDEQ